MTFEATDASMPPTACGCGTCEQAARAGILMYNDLKRNIAESGAPFCPIWHRRVAVTLAFLIANEMIWRAIREAGVDPDSEGAKALVHGMLDYMTVESTWICNRLRGSDLADTIQQASIGALPTDEIPENTKMH